MNENQRELTQEEREMIEWLKNASNEEVFQAMKEVEDEIFREGI